MLQKLGAPHVESFNYMLREGLQKAVADIMPMEFRLANDDKASVTIVVRSSDSRLQYQ